MSLKLSRLWAGDSHDMSSQLFHPRTQNKAVIPIGEMSERETQEPSSYGGTEPTNKPGAAQG